MFTISERGEGRLKLRPDDFSGLRMAGREDIGRGEDHELLPVVHGECNGRKITLQGVRRASPGNFIPSTWAVLRAWEGAHLDEPQKALVVRTRIAVSSLAHWVSQGLATGKDTLTAPWPRGGTLTIPQAKDWGWASLEYDRPRTLEDAEHDGFMLASLESVLAGQAPQLPAIEAHLADGAVVTDLVRDSGLIKPLLTTTDFPGGLADVLQRFSEVWDSMPLVVERLHEAQGRQTALARALLVTSCLEPLFDRLYEPTDDDALAFARRKRRILRWIFRASDKAWVSASLGSGLSFHEKVKRLLIPLQKELGWSDQERDTWVNNFHGLRVELAHHPVALYRSNTRWLESTRLCNLGLTVALYHLWLALGALPNAASKAAGAYWRNWQTWTLPSAVDEPLGDRRKKRRPKTKKKRRAAPGTSKATGQ